MPLLEDRVSQADAGFGEIACRFAEIPLSLIPLSAPVCLKRFTQDGDGIAARRPSDQSPGAGSFSRPMAIIAA